MPETHQFCGGKKHRKVGGDQNAGPREEPWVAILKKVFRVGIIGQTTEGRGMGRREWPVGRPTGRSVAGVLNHSKDASVSGAERVRTRGGRSCRAS